MAARNPVDTRLRATRLQPVAYPDGRLPSTIVDSGAKKSAELADALSGFAPILSEYAFRELDREDKTTARAAAQQAEKDFVALQEAEQTYGEAMNQGLIFNHQNPLYRKHYDDAMGTLLAGQMFGNWIAYREENLSDATTLEQYDEAHDAFMEANVGEFFGDFEPGQSFNKTWAGYLIGDRQNFARTAAENMANQVDEAFYGNVLQVFRNSFGERYRPEDVALSIDALIQSRILVEGPGITKGEKQRIGRTAIKAILDGAATAALNPDNVNRITSQLIGVLDNLPWGPGGKAIGVSWVQEMLKDAESRVRTNESQGDALKQRQDTETVADLKLELMGMALQGVDGTLIRQRAEQIRVDVLPGIHGAVQGDFEYFLQNVGGLRRSIDSLDVGEDNERAVDQWYLRASRNPSDVPGLTRALEVLFDGRSITADRFREMHAFLRSLQAGGGSFKDFTNTAPYERGEQIIRNVLANTKDFLEKATLMETFDERLLEERAMSAYMQYAYSYFTGSDEIDTALAIADFSDRAMDLVRQAVFKSLTPTQLSALEVEFGLSENKDAAGFLAGEAMRTGPLTGEWGRILGWGQIGQDTFDYLDGMLAGTRSSSLMPERIMNHLKLLPDFDISYFDENPQALRDLVESQRRYYPSTMNQGRENDGT